jgi:pimeloyl-ACP methyl ester carboxylesterase
MLALVADKGPSAVVERDAPEARRRDDAGVASCRRRAGAGARALELSGGHLGSGSTALMTPSGFDADPRDNPRADVDPLRHGGHHYAAAMSQNMHKAIPGSELVLIPEAGHLSSVERPDAFNDALANFLNHRV